MNLSNCSNCGLCKASCPVFNIKLRESAGPRGKAIAAKKQIYDRIFYDCTLCNACKFECPIEIDLVSEFKKAREELIKQGIETPTNKRMIFNIRKYGNPFEPGKKPKELYCC